MLSTADIVAWLNIPESDGDHDAVIAALEPRAVEFFQRQTGRYFGPTQSVLEVFNGTGGRSLWLTDSPQAGSVVASYRVPGSSSWTAFPVSSYEAQDRRILLYPELAYVGGSFLLNVPDNSTLSGSSALGWPVGYNNIQIAYDRGYEATEPGPDEEDPATQLNVPGDVRQAVLELVETWWKNRVTATPAFIPEGAETVQIPRSVEATIRNWRTPAIAGYAAGIVTVVPESP